MYFLSVNRIKTFNTFKFIFIVHYYCFSLFTRSIIFIIILILMLLF